MVLEQKDFNLQNPEECCNINADALGTAVDLITEVIQDGLNLRVEDAQTVMTDVNVIQLGDNLTLTPGDGRTAILDAVGGGGGDFSPGDPTAQVGELPVNGVEQRFMRSDAAPRLTIAAEDVLGGVRSGQNIPIEPNGKLLPRLAIGEFAGELPHGDFAIALGYQAGRTNQGVNAISVGTGAGVSNQLDQSIAIGRNAGARDQSRGIGIGVDATARGPSYRFQRRKSASASLVRL